MSNFPRRIQFDLMTPAEVAIHNATQEVEKLPADPMLTEAVMLLKRALDKVADFVDAVHIVEVSKESSDE